MQTPDVVGDQKLSIGIADQIALEILQNGWTIGESLGREEDLVAKFGVSRWVLREALSLLEQDGIVTIKRGPSGGVVVSEPVSASLTHRMRRYFLFSGVRSQELIETRTLLDRLVFRLAWRNMAPDNRRELSEFLSRVNPDNQEEGLRSGVELNRRLMGLTDNMILTVFTETLLQSLIGRGMLRNMPAYRTGKMNPMLADALRYRIEQVRYLIDDDLPGLNESAARFAQSYSNIYRNPTEDIPNSSVDFISMQNERQADLFYKDKQVKKSGNLAFAIQAMILRKSLVPGDPIGKEAELQAEFDVGRGVLREALRLLERDGFIVTEEGRSGGIKVGVPDPADMIRSTLLYLTFAGVSETSVFECTAAIEPALLQQIIARPTSELRRELDALQFETDRLVSPETKLAVQMHRFYYSLAECAGPKVLSLFTKILSRLVILELPKGSDESVAKSDFHRRGQALVRALHTRNLDLCLGCLQDIYALGMAYDGRKRTPRELLAVST